MFTIYKVIEKFLKSHLKSDAPLLLGYSGGPDSLALLHALLMMKQQFNLNLHLAHVDHGWRPESAQEANKLLQQAVNWGLPFHLKTISPNQLKGNLEAACREARLKFFGEVSNKIRSQAVLLAHHADDQAETVLKRALEGASFPYLSSLSPVKEMMGMTLWRPFLQVHKSQILEYLNEHQLVPLNDYTNDDPSFLRARMRTSILPELSRQFGKEVIPSLVRMAEDAQELRSCLDERVAPFLAQAHTGPLGVYLELGNSHNLSSFELKYLIRKVCDTQDFSLVRPLVDQVAEWILSDVADHQVQVKGWMIYVDRKNLFLVKEGKTLEWKLELKEGKDYHFPTNWRSAWLGLSTVCLPNGEYRLAPPIMSAPFKGGVSLGKWWTNHKVPALLRRLLPVIWEGEKIQHEVLTGKSKIKVEACSSFYQIVASAVELDTE